MYTTMESFCRRREEKSRAPVIISGQGWKRSAEDRNCPTTTGMNSSVRYLLLMDSLFDLDGITIYSESGAQLVCRNGNYMVEVPDGRGLFEDEKYLALFGDDDNFIESNTLKLRFQDPAAFAVMQKQEIGASLQCLSRKEGVPNVIVNYDVFNRNRKWSDEDITLLTILGHCIGNLLNYSE